MPKTINDVVDWLTSPDWKSNRVCFNLAQQSFLLYRDDAAHLMEVNRMGGT